MSPVELFNTLAEELIGWPISHVWRGYGSAVFLEFGDLTAKARRDGSPGHPEGEISLGIEWSWRIEDSSRILGGSWSDDKVLETALGRLQGHKVAGIGVFGALPEIAITTDGGLRLLSFATTEGQPRWYLVDQRIEPAQWLSVRSGALHLGDGSESAK